MSNKEKSQSTVELQKLVIRYEQTAILKKQLLEETKADLAAVRYDIARLLLDFTKPIPDDKDAQKIVSRKLKETVDLIAAKEAVEEQILTDYYTYQAEYVQYFQAWRRKFIQLVEKQEEDQTMAASTKARANPQGGQVGKLIIWDDDAEDRKKEADWKGQLVPFSDLQYNESGFLGAGAFGSVYRGSIYHSPCAIKVLNNRYVNAEARESFRDEVRTLSNLQHDRILKFLGAVLDDEHLCLVTDLADNGSAADKLFPPSETGKKKKKTGRKDVYYELAPRRKLSIIKGIVDGMIFLHHNNVIHYDLKPENILLDDQFNPVIADFGLTRVFGLEDILGLNSNVAGTLWYMAPEILSDRPMQSPKVDIYAFAIIAYEIWLQQRWEWAATTPSKLLEMLLGNEKTKPYRPPFTGTRVPFPDDLAYLINKCWDSVPANRPDFIHMVKIRQLEKSMERERLRNETKNLVDSTKKAQATAKLTSLSKIVDEVDVWMSMSNSIADQEAGVAHTLWEKMAGKNDKMDWNKFTEQFAVVTHVDPFKPEEAAILKAAFDIPEETPDITKNDFVAYCKFFGVKPNVPALIELFHEPWYFGKLDSAQSCAVLTVEKDDTNRFLIRMSGSRPGTFAMSVRVYNKKSPAPPTHFTLSQIQDYTRLCGAMKNNSLLKELLNRQKISGWKPPDKTCRPPIILLACEKYARLKKNKKGASDKEDAEKCYRPTGTFGEATTFDQFRPDAQ